MTAAIMEEVDWSKAACAGMSRDIFFPEDYALPDEAAIKTCRRCPIRESCATFAIERNEEFGIWGGLTEDQRRAANRTRSRVRCPDCRSENVMDDGQHEVCLNCGLSWSV